MTALLIAAEEHGPGRHGPVVAVIAIALVVGALIYGLVSSVRKRKLRKRSAHDPESDRGHPDAKRRRAGRSE